MLRNTASIASNLDGLSTGFEHPPATSRPHAYWMWMNGNVTHEGITLDLEAMQRFGIGGFYIYQDAVGIPRGPVDYGSGAWLDLMRFAIVEAKRLGLVVAIHNAPGYSGTGGPWITPEYSMQELVWTETIVDGGNPVEVRLPEPHPRAGFYRDALLLAYPSLPVEEVTMRGALQSATCNGAPLAIAQLLSRDRALRYRLEQQDDGAIGTLCLTFTKPFTARAISVYRSPEIPLDPYDGPRDYPPELMLEASPDGHTFTKVCSIRMPALRSLNAPGVASFSPVTATHFRLRSSAPTFLIDIDLHSGPRLQDWAAKANFTAYNASANLPPALAAEVNIDPDSVQDISSHLVDAVLRWTPPPGRWTVVRLGHTTTEEVVGAAPESAIGLECDKLSTRGVDLHFARSIDPLLAHLGSLKGDPLQALTIDSWEAGKGNWTADFPAGFREFRGYDLRPWVLAMTGRIVGNPADSERFLFDLRRTQATMVAQKYYGHFQKLCHERGLQLYAEPYGDGTFDSMEVAEHLDLTMSEFWVRYLYGSNFTVDLAAGATHTLGKTVAASEAFTGAPQTARWTGHPYAFKAEGDRMFTMGINRFVFHTFVHQPYSGARPGMTMGPFGTHFDRNNTWMERDAGWCAYVTRAQHLLQSGVPVAEFCLLKGEEPMSGVPDPRIGPLAVPQQFGVDIVSPGAVMKHALFERGRVHLGASASYRCMLLHPDALCTPALLSALLTLVKSGMTLVTAAIPGQVPTLEGGADGAARYSLLLKELWADLRGSGLQKRFVGNGTLVLTNAISPVIAMLGLEPRLLWSADDAGADLLWTHRRVEDDDMYFLCNQRRRRDRFKISFGRMPSRIEIWNAETGIQTLATDWSVVSGRTELIVPLEAATSIFIVFRKSVPPQPAIRLSNQVHSSEGIAAPLLQDFTIMVWAQPETYAQRGSGFLAYPADGYILYGEGHAVAGLAAGQNGVFVYECSHGAPRVVLETHRALAGWTHLGLRYRDGVPSLMIDGEVVATGKRSVYSIHAPLPHNAQSADYPRYFEGNSTQLIVSELISEQAVRTYFLAGLPPPPLPQGIEITQSLNGPYTALAWTSGSFELSVGAHERRAEAAVAEPRTIAGPWRISLSPEAGAPLAVTLPHLQSLRLHEDPRVRYSAGNVRYSTIFALSEDELRRGRAPYLDLGRVNVIARIWLNGQDLGSLWKPPFRIGLGDAAHAGENHLTIEVTTLWPNRLIGDEHLPAENLYDEHGPIVKLPEWYTSNKASPGSRVTFSTWHTYSQNDPLLDSGLLGPVVLLFPLRIIGNP